jgi:hypothetical protein
MEASVLCFLEPGYDTNKLILQWMKMRMFHDLEARGKNWHKELPSVLWALQTNINRATRDTPFNLIYGADAMMQPEIYLESARWHILMKKIR